MKKLLLIAVLLLASCAPDSNIKPTLDRTEQEITITVKFHDNRDSLEAAYREINKLPANAQIPEQWGFAKWNQWMDANGNFVLLPGAQLRCDIHTFKPKRQDDQIVLTMGHELLHCVYGSYHD
jgi:hypothetical protein